MNDLIKSERIENMIHIFRGQKVVLDYDIAQLYQVPTKRLNEQVKRNTDRFPADFMFQLSEEEYDILIANFGKAKLKSQFATSRWGGRRKLPYAFTEQGVAMLSSILRSKRAAHVNIAIMRAFVKLREILSAHKELAHKLNELEQKIGDHDVTIKAVFKAIRKLMAPPKKPRRKIGFIID